MPPKMASLLGFTWSSAFADNGLSSTALALNREPTANLATILLDTSLLHLEHPEPRIRTLVANAVGANDAFLVLNHKLGNTNSADDQHYNRLASSIEEHNMERGATDSPEAQKEESPFAPRSAI
jgi:hypothetical protein